MHLPQNHLIALLIILIAMFLTVRMRKLTLPAAITGGLIGAIIFSGAGFAGMAMMAAFFIAGTAATHWKANIKNSLGITDITDGCRTTAQVIANAGVAAILGIYIYLLPEQSDNFRLMMAAGFSAAMADTLSSELGNVYGSRYFNIVTFKRDHRGLDGVISLEGTVAGIIGTLIIAAIYSIGFGWSINFLWIVIGGVIGNLADSVLGATVERKGYLDNNLVNFLNTSVGALLALALA